MRRALLASCSGERDTRNEPAGTWMRVRQEISWRNSFWLRVAVAQALASLTLATLLFCGLYVGTSHFARHQLRDEIADESAVSAAEAATQGSDALRKDIDLRHARGGWYTLRDAQGALLAGDARIANLPAGWHEQPYPAPLKSAHERAEHGLLLLVTPLADGAQLYVGRDTYSVYELGELFRNLFGWILVTSIVLAALGGAWLGRIVQRRMQALRVTTRAVGAGDLSQRITRGTRRDEFDAIEAHVNDMLDRIENLMARLREVSLDIAHDLRTPMSRLRQRLEVARGACTEGTPMAETLDAAIVDLDTQLATFAALLRIARIEDGSARAHFRREDLGALALGVAEIYAPVADDAGCTLTTQINAGVFIQGDSDLLTQLLVNLIENAIQHTPRGSRILVAVSGQPDSLPTLLVEDNGPGIAVAQRERVLLPRVRLDSARGGSGNGLGLSLVKAIADLHGADLQLEDTRPGLRVRLQFTG